MGSAGNESRNDESQASQLLAAALRPRDPQPNPPVQDESHGSDGSLHSSNANSIHYHMNGLMPTQSQSLYGSQDPAIFGEGSQKENAPTPAEKIIQSPRRSSGDGSPHRSQAGSYPSPPLDVVATATNAKDNACAKIVGLSSHPNKPPSKGGKAVSFASPARPAGRPQPAVRAATTPANPMPPPSRRYRSLSPASQDSFAGPLPERDPIQAYIESSKAFQIPLSRLGDDSQSLSEGEDGPPPVSTNMWASRPRNRATRSSSPPGKVLVEGTPSNSSRSNDSQCQSQSQHQVHHSQVQNVDSQESGGDTQLSDLFPPGQAQSLEAEMALMDTDIEEPSQHARSDASPEPSSSYERLVNQDPFSPLPESTQPAHMTVDQTQVVEYSRPSYEADASSILQHHDFYNDNGQVVFPTIPPGGRSVRSADTTASTTAPRGLLGLVAPHKRYRYLDIKPSTGASTQLATGDAAANTTAGLVDDLDETQIVDDSAPMISVSETQPSHAPVIQESIQSMPPKRTLPTATRMLQNLRARLQSPRTEIVPDSEETRIVPDSDPPAPFSSSPLTDPPTAQSTPAKPRSRRGLQSEDEVLQAVTREVTAPSISAVPEEEEEDDEDDVPLAATVQSAKAKGKRRAVESPEPESYAAPSPKPPKKPGFLDRGLAQNSSSWRDTVIPSSDPQERREEAEVQPRSAKPKTPVTQIAPPLPKTRSAPRQAKLAAKKRLHESSSDEDEDEAMPDADDDDKDTEPADDQMDVDVPGPSSKPARGGKRKRTVSSSARKNSNKSNGAKTPKEEVNTPATRPPKRLKSGSSARIVSGIDATRVFALWKTDGHYYPGTVYSLVGPGRYHIYFDDDTEQDAELKFMRACLFKAGDHVLLEDKSRAKVVNSSPSDIAGHRPDDAITLDLDLDGEETVEVRSIILASRTVGAEWGDRILTEDAISTILKPKVPTPTPKGTPAPSENSTRAGRKPLHKTGLVITSSPSNAGAAREALVTGIRKHGGVVLDDWSTLFAMDGAVDKRGQRWILKAEDIKWTGRTDVERAFLISDDNHQKPKFLIALALGIPCLSVEWVTSCISQGVEVDWQPYLLPAGFSEHLNTRVSQLVDLDWGNSIEHLRGINENLVAAKVFSDMAILCVNKLFVTCRGKNKKESNPSAEAVPQIILCMGAELVEAVSDQKHASRPLEKYDYVVVREDADRAPFHNVVQHCVDVNWVKDCLTSGRLLPPPPPRPDT
ncbi:uncharacterized protein TRAVEDRAFT_165083 [Trametes versicolor FP-101664 SS1]|uniref:uncharacterized protein n=1 Tax=Trametes versicolor (strain FP-101664) TaxID=717944 RepID=UPI0004623DB1|nr:uncharacterized protein TRAVEDRAFT_165083 [Trametes versicolor FP-101664 SS1]EIW60358.1 hypothetical protein TRAVEDRAFT_165083 [Trametes versicolor FP-101664 SS1]